MKIAESVDVEGQLEGDVDESRLFRQMVRDQVIEAAPTPRIDGIVIGELLAIVEDGRTPLVTFRARAEPAALAARSTIDLQGTHVGRQVVLAFEDGDPARPIVMGILGTDGWPFADRANHVEVDGERLIVSAKDQLVLRCGKASITLTKAGKVLIQGEYVLSRSSGINRIKGGAVQLN